MISKISSLKLGVLGGGQLGLMLCQAAMNYGLELYVMDPDRDASCSRYTSHFTRGSITDEDEVYEFGKRLDLITIEIENVSVAGLKRLEAEGIRVFPQPHIIEMIQDKGLQKLFFAEHKIPSAAFVFVDNRDSLHSWLGMLPAVMKSRRTGYDGRGVVKINKVADISGGFDVPSILEETVHYTKEISVIVARNAAGQIETYDAVEMEFNPDANLVEFLIAPARISYTEEAMAKALAIRIIDELKMIGILAVEMFLTADGTVLVNELAPRPHNSGHHTIEANFTSQYDQHIRALLNFSLGTCTSRSNAVMVNLLGARGFSGKTAYTHLEEVIAMEGVYVHLYAKKETRFNRKMGHVTVVDSDLEKAYGKARFIQDNLKVIAEN